MIDLRTEEWQEGQPTKSGIYCVYDYDGNNPEDDVNLVVVSLERKPFGKEQVLVYRHFGDEVIFYVSGISHFIGPIILPKPPNKVTANPTSA